VALCVLLPLKFGIAVNNGEIAFFPVNVYEWILTPWPPFALPALCGVGLVLANPGMRIGRRQAMAVAAAASLVVAALAGLLRTTEHEYAQLFLWHLLGTLALALAVATQTARDPASRHWLLGAVVCGMFLASVGGWTQVVGGGYRETAEFVRQMEAGAIDDSSEQILAKLEAGRASGPFVYPNSFAAHLLLTLPLGVAVAWGWGGRFSPVSVSRPLFALVVGVVGCGALVMTRSRASLVALATAALLAVLAICLRQRKIRLGAIAAAAAVALVAAAVLLAINRGRSLSSVDARLEYYRAGTEMFLHAPVAGVGLGEFFPWYMRLKPGDAEDTRIPHSVFFLFAAQCGLVGLVAVVGWWLLSAYLLLPPAAGAGRPGLLSLATFVGGLAWLLHSLVDFNFQIPGTVGTFSVLLVLATGCGNGMEGGGSAPGSPDNRYSRGLQAAAVLLAVLCMAGLWRMPGELAYQRFYTAAADPEAPWPAVDELARIARSRLPLSPYPDIVLSKRAAAEGRTEESERALSRALSRCPHRGSLWYALAATRASLGDVRGAREAYREAVKWQPESPYREFFGERD
jgi:O-antigen ligase